MARYEFLLVCCGLGAVLTLGATFGSPGNTAAHGLRAELLELVWADGDGTNLRAPRVSVDLVTRTAVTSLRGRVRGTAVEVQALTLGQLETRFEGVRARGSLSERTVSDLEVERLDVRQADLAQLSEQAGAGLASESPPGETLEHGAITLGIARGGVRLTALGVAWLEGVELVNSRGDRLTIETISIPWGAEEWTCGGVRLVEAGAERRFERLSFVGSQLLLLEPQTLMMRLSGADPEVVLNLGTWQ